VMRTSLFWKSMRVSIGARSPRLCNQSKYIFRSEQSKRFPQLGQVILQFFSRISVPQRSQIKMRFLAAASFGLSASLKAE
jgi:hypothetical protein